MIRTEEVYKIGVLNKPHGTKGELSFSFEDDIFDRVDCDYLILLLDGILVPFFIESYRFKSNSTALIKFEGIDDMDRAAQFTNTQVFFKKEFAEKLEDGPMTWQFFLDFTIVDKTIGELGKVISVEDSTSNVLFVVQHNDDELYIPAHEEFILEVNHEKKELLVNLPEGLVSLND